MKQPVLIKTKLLLSGRSPESSEWLLRFMEQQQKRNKIK